MTTTQLITPEKTGALSFTSAEEAVEALINIYATQTKFLQTAFSDILNGAAPKGKYRAFYPKVSLTTHSFANIDSRLSFGHVPAPGTYSTTVTRPDLYRHYLIEQFTLLLKSHNVPLKISTSNTPIPVHFAMAEDTIADKSFEETLNAPLRDYFDVPDLSSTDDRIVNGDVRPDAQGEMPLALFTAQRVDYSLARLSHYTATRAEYFQNFVLFTNYQFYIEGFIDYALSELDNPDSPYEAFIEPGNIITRKGEKRTEIAPKNPQMPAYHLIGKDGGGITMVNIGVGPSNAKTITDHIAVLRPHAWLMLGHCAGLRNSQSLGDYVLAHAYLREDHVLDDDLPVWVPIPALAEIQIALEDAVADVTKLDGFELKKIMRTGTVATIDNRNWELRDHSGPIRRLSLSRAVALDMESATIAANGFRFRVPYGTLLCVSDKPLHGELKLPGMATSFYKKQVSQHLRIGIRTMQLLSEMPIERLHSRKLRSFEETAFL